METVEERHGMAEVMSVMPGMHMWTHRTNAGMITSMAMMPAAIRAIAVSAIGTEAMATFRTISLATLGTMLPAIGTITLATLGTVLSAFGTITLATLGTVLSAFGAISLATLGTALSAALMAIVGGSATILISTLRTYGLRLCLTRTVALRLTAAGIGCN